ncbi:hypothetical protein MBO_07523 [Moraxella bovoculi 237]|uniref:Uncharacterized protein n=1 Tax=Moraxella bovoculi 237 TaxID=743974 RepID=A0A066UKV4_9GAMM|nr:hypothetical protein MBO_07523 [Moraxella bovoculi 237]
MQNYPHYTNLLGDLSCGFYVKNIKKYHLSHAITFRFFAKNLTD